jgi:hypothetical protein
MHFLDFYVCNSIYLHHNSHLNVEVSAQIENVKYLHKYLVKMPDRAEVAVKLAEGQDMDETKMFLDGRYISTSEAVWRALRFQVHYQKPAVKRLAVHLKGEESVLFEEHGNLDLEDVLQRKQSTTLQAWFESNKAEGLGKHLLYPDYCSEYTFAKGKWKQPDLLVCDFFMFWLMFQLNLKFLNSDDYFTRSIVVTFWVKLWVLMSNDYFTRSMVH